MAITFSVSIPDDIADKLMEATGAKNITELRDIVKKSTRIGFELLIKKYEKNGKQKPTCA